MFFGKSILNKIIRNKGKLFFLSFFKLGLIVFVTIALLNFPTSVSGQNTNTFLTSNPYTFTLNNAAVTSAGVYNSVDSTLIRTLWSNVNYNAGTYNIKWDGKDDIGNAVPAGNYIVKVVSSNVKYTWQGTIGNTSDVDTGNTVHRGYYACMVGMTVVNGTAYYGTGYSEGSPSYAKLLLSKPQSTINFIPFNTSTANTGMVVNDGKTVYWAAADANAISNTFVFGTNVSDDSYVAFPNGVSFTPKYRGAINVINLVNQTNSVITGLAVQSNGRFLFVARAGLNQLAVLDKGTGQLIQTLSVNNPKALCTDMQGNLWMVSDINSVTRISKYQVNSNGTLSSPLLTISSVLAPVALAVSPDNSTLAVADADLSSQQVKAFDNSAGKASWTLGTPGGYMTDATVTNNKFYFNDVRSQINDGWTNNFQVFIAFQPDGSFWVNDPGNYRVQHYAANRTFVETIMSLGSCYSTWADKNDNTRVGASYLEFKINNSQPLTGTTGWQLVKNWGATISSAYDKTVKFTNVITLTSAGVKRTFGFLRQGNLYYLVEFQSNNSLRFTTAGMAQCNIESDGSLLTNGLIRYAFQGFDNFNNPIWSNTPQVLADISKLQDTGPLPKIGFRNTYVTSSGKVIFYDYCTQSSYNPITYNTGFHLGAIQQGGNSWLWKSAVATHLNYRGPFPDAAHFDIGNGVNNYAGSSAMVLGRNIITGYHGEFWKASQTNMFNHYLDNGLAIGQFGTVGPFYYTNAPGMMAGNALSPQLVNGANPDQLYLYHGDESYHAGMHKWLISGLNTIKEQDIPITFPSTALATVTLPGNDLMVNLPYNSSLLNNTAGWTMSPTAAQTGWTLNTNILVSGVQNSPDIYINCQSATGTFSLNRDLGNNSGLQSWSLTGQISYYFGQQGGNMRQYFDVLDNKGKIIARIDNNYVFVGAGTSTNAINGNNKTLVSGVNDTFIQPIIYALQPVEISAANNLVTISYAGHSVTASIYDPTADISSPKTMRAYFTGGYNPTGRTFDFKDMRFITAKLNQVININPITATAFGNPVFPVVAAASSNLPVSFSVISGPATILGNAITITGSGTVVVQASQAGNSFYNAAPPVTQTFTVASVRTDL